MTRTLSEAESKRVLARYGIPVVTERVVASPEHAVRAAQEIGYPVAVKLCGERVAHKTERGLVRLGLATDDAVREAGASLLEAAELSDGKVELLVARMVSGSRELIAGISTDPQFGPCVMVGVGGILAEVIGDVAVRLVPLAPIDAAEMLDDLAAGAVLGAVRGEPPVDRASITEVLLGLSQLAATETEVRSVDVNPLIIADGYPIAVDALVEVME